MEGTKHYQDIGYQPPEDMFNATDDEIESVVNLAALSYELEEMDLEGLVSSDITLDTVESEGGETDYVYVVKDKELVKLVLDHPEDNLAIFDLMWEKRTANPTVLASIMYSETPALGDGVI